MVPLIGVTTGPMHENSLLKYGDFEGYFQAIVKSGAIPVVIPNKYPDEKRQALVNRIDGLLLSGGGDIAPHLFGGDSHPAVNLIDPDRDELELELIKLVIEQRKPFLAICRGIQLLNVALGGTLYTHIPDQLSSTIRHDYFDDYPRDYVAHRVKLEDDSSLSQIIGRTSVDVNSMHHQGINMLGEGLEAVGYTSDGLVEAVELDQYVSFGLGVQWHPECMISNSVSTAIFNAFIEAAD